MTVVTYNCAVCGSKMVPTANPNLFLCSIERSRYLPEFKESLYYYDYAVEFNSEGGCAFRQYDLFPFRIFIRSKENYPSNYGTTVKKATMYQSDLHFEHMDPYLDWDLVFTTTEELELPWNDY